MPETKRDRLNAAIMRYLEQSCTQVRNCAHGYVDIEKFSRLADEILAWHKQEMERVVPSVEELTKAIPYRCAIRWNENMGANIATAIHSLYEEKLGL